MFVFVTPTCYVCAFLTMTRYNGRRKEEKKKAAYPKSAAYPVIYKCRFSHRYSKVRACRASVLSIYCPDVLNYMQHMCPLFTFYQVWDTPQRYRGKDRTSYKAAKPTEACFLFYSAIVFVSNAVSFPLPSCLQITIHVWVVSDPYLGSLAICEPLVVWIYVCRRFVPSMLLRTRYVSFLFILNCIIVSVHILIYTCNEATRWQTPKTCTTG